MNSPNGEFCKPVRFTFPTANLGAPPCMVVCHTNDRNRARIPCSITKFGTTPQTKPHLDTIRTSVLYCLQAAHRRRGTRPRDRHPSDSHPWSRAHPSSGSWRSGSDRCMTWAVPTQPPARSQTVTPGSTRGPTQKTVIARRETTRSTPPKTGRSFTLNADAHTRIPRTGRSEGPLCPPVPSLGEAWRCEPLVFNLGNRSLLHTPYPSTQAPHEGV
jgi:hypothetical protein